MNRRHVIQSALAGAAAVAFQDNWVLYQPEVLSRIDSARIGIWGTSFGGGVVTHVAAHDIRVKACVAQAPIMDGGYWIRSLNRESDYLAIRQYLIEARRRRAFYSPPGWRDRCAALRWTRDPP